MKRRGQISGAELEVMQILWEADEPLNIQAVCDRLPKGKWAYKTVGTLLVRMEEKGAVVSEKKGRVNYYTPLLDKEAYTKEQTKEFVSRLYHGSVKDLAVSLFKSEDMTEEDIDEIRKMFDL
ncbi:MAG TPA: BlaI/MecI/CopY family transcriptional regulator [Candidatus Ornithomonoglobus intestinigallinarum]|uniref:BlaI/MecI/CopY family transcriptional regulator n=1 Tax=Candidatus Ornithomonoglobus intestinigallinarum TaxID=2840894 RepID=A0A9D1KPM7_9FIRM|nr:BlaI/MecI/CopY family transcriptional regulator [Candidatus Ornithomonoglobus intestinigallinarum]